jgi:hypothetical protein
MKSSFYLQKKNELLELIENTLQRLLKSEDLAKVNSQWLLDEIYRIKKEVETDSFSSEKTGLGVFSLRVNDDLVSSDQDLWSKIAKIGDEYRKLQRNA